MLPAFPAHTQPAILRTWQEAHAVMVLSVIMPYAKPATPYIVPNSEILNSRIALFYLHHIFQVYKQEK